MWYSQWKEILPCVKKTTLAASLYLTETAFGRTYGFKNKLKYWLFCR